MLYIVGGRLILQDFNPAEALRTIVEERVTAMAGVPILYESIAALPEFVDADLSELRTTICGGASIPGNLLQAWAEKGAYLRGSYGLTEASGGVTLLPRERYHDKSSTAGFPALETEVCIADESGRPVPTGEIGEILVKGPHVMTGYWGDSEATAQAFYGDWLRTGDLGSLDDEGFLSVVDRQKDMIISGGINVYPAEIERVINMFPGVEEAVATNVPHERWGETVALTVVGDIEIDKLWAHARKHLSPFKLPRYISHQQVPLPRGMSGKLLRRVVREQFDVSGAVRTEAE